MERDIWLEHMESRCGCDEDGFEDAESGAEANGERGAVHGSDSTHISATPGAQQVADDAALRVARSSWANTKLLMKAMDVKL